MATRPGVKLDAIEMARRSVIELTLAHQATARVSRKQAVRGLFGTLMASWEAGVSFDAMAKALNVSGIDITPETLRGYFFELKTKEQLRSENDAHKQALAKLRQENEAKQRSRDLQHARELARVGIELRNCKHAANVEAAAHQVASEAVQAEQRRSISADSALATDDRNLLPIVTLGKNKQIPPHHPTGVGTHVSGALNAGNGTAAVLLRASPIAGKGADIQRVKLVLPPSAPGAMKAGTTGVGTSTIISVGDLQTGQARTLDEIARFSQGRKESSLDDDLVLKADNTVWCASGKAFNGYLSPRTLHTLRNVGRVIAPTIGRSEKDFVPMSHEL